MAHAVLQAVASRLEREGRLRGPLAPGFLELDSATPHLAGERVLERPPLASLRAAA